MKDQIDIWDTFYLLYFVKITSEHQSDIRVCEIYINLNSYMVKRQDQDQLSLFPDAGEVFIKLAHMSLKKCFIT